MKRSEKKILSKQRILNAALEEFSKKSYDSASINTVCLENGISKGIIYHYFKDKDDIYLQCVALCFENLTAYIKEHTQNIDCSIEKQLQQYFDARIRFFAKSPIYLGIFFNSAINPPPHLESNIAQIRKSFDDFTISILTKLLEQKKLRKDINLSLVVEDFRMYMDYFNFRFKLKLEKSQDPKTTLLEHEERSHHQLNILLYGVLDSKNERQ